MVAKNTIYQNGHFYSEETGKRLEMVSGKPYILMGERSGFAEPQPAGNPPPAGELPPPVVDLEKRKAQGKLASFYKVLDAGTMLYVQIGHNGKPYKFSVVLTQALYVFTFPAHKKREYQLADCYCCVTGCAETGLPYFEPVWGNSLNQVYKNTYVHFFNNQGSPSVNVFDRFNTDVAMHDYTFLRESVEAVLVQNGTSFPIQNLFDDADSS